MSLIAYELRRIIGRKGSFFGAMGVAFAIALLVVFLVDSPDQTEDVWSQVLGIPLVFGATVVGALAGSYDTAQGTMRYLVLTGVPRWRLVAIRIPALIIAIVAISVPAALAAFYGMSTGDATSTEIVRGIGGSVTYAAVWGIVSMVVGTLLRSNGAGIAVALVLFLVGNIITAAVQSEISQTVGDYLLPNVVSVFALFGHVPENVEAMTDMAWGASAVALVLWLIGLTALAIGRVERDEY